MLQARGGGRTQGQSLTRSQATRTAPALLHRKAKQQLSSEIRHLADSLYAPVSVQDPDAAPSTSGRQARPSVALEWQLMEALKSKQSVQSKDLNRLDTGAAQGPAGRRCSLPGAD